MTNKPLSGSNQQGIGHIALIAVVLAILTLSVIGYFVYGNRTGSENSADTSPPGSTCSYDDEDLCKFFAGYEAGGHSTVTAVHKEAGGEESVVTVKANGSRSHLTLESPETYEAVIIDDTSYIKSPDGTWWQQSGEDETLRNLKDSAQINLKEPAASGDGGQITYQRLEKEACGDLTCFKYRESGDEDDETTYFWFDDQDYRLRRAQIVAGDSAQSDFSFTYEEVSISRPESARQLADGQRITPGQTRIPDLPATGDDPTEEELQMFIEQNQ